MDKEQITKITDKSIFLFDQMKRTDSVISLFFKIIDEDKKYELSVTNFENISIKRNIELENYIILFGIQFSSGNVYFCSAEEHKGSLGIEVEISGQPLVYSFRELNYARETTSNSK